MSKRILQIIRPGILPFNDAETLQKVTAQKLADGEIPDTMILLEHPHTYSFGRQGDVSNLLWNNEQIETAAIDLVWTNRGGDVTYHGPGQLVGYPILKLGEPGNIDVQAYLRKLEEVLIQSLLKIGIESIRVMGNTGVWVPDKNDGEPPAKIASIGVKVDVYGISRHGFALNISPDMNYWKGINACGLENQNKTSIQALNPEASDLGKISDLIEREFIKHFNFTRQNPVP